MHGISFETLPSVWPNESIFPALTYAQCVELEAYWEMYHDAGKPRLQVELQPIPHNSWVKYFTLDGEDPPCKWVLKNIIVNWRIAKAKYHTSGLPKVTNHPHSKASYEKMLQYHHNAMIAIAASPANIIEDDAHQSQSGSRQSDVLDHAEFAADLSSSEPKPPSLLNFVRRKVGSPASPPPPEDISMPPSAVNISRSSDHQVSDGNCGDTDFMNEGAITKMVDALEGKNPHRPLDRWIYAEREPTKTPIKIHPHGRRENGIETHRGFSATFQALEDSLRQNNFAIYDTSERVLELMKTSPRVHGNPFLSPAVRQKIYARLCAADHETAVEYMPNGRDIDLNKVRGNDNPLTMSLRSAIAGTKRKRDEAETVDPPPPAPPPLSTTPILHTPHIQSPHPTGPPLASTPTRNPPGPLMGAHPPAQPGCSHLFCCHRLDPPPSKPSRHRLLLGRPWGAWFIELDD
jgi:hypothetical protein